METIEVETGAKPTGAIIWMHGLGADGHDFEPIVPELVQQNERALRFVFPNAPVRPVTINGGYAMRAWYDIVGIDRNSAQDETGIRASDAMVQALIKRENERGIPSERIVLAGFSQGGAMALFSGTRYAEKLAGIMALSCYMLSAKNFDTERAAANASTPIFMAHGPTDPVVHGISVKTRVSCSRRRATRSNGTRIRCRTRYARKKFSTSRSGCAAFCREDCSGLLTLARDCAIQENLARRQLRALDELIGLVSLLDAAGPADHRGPAGALKLPAFGAERDGGARPISLRHAREPAARPRHHPLPAAARLPAPR